MTRGVTGSDPAPRKRFSRAEHAQEQSVSRAVITVEQRVSGSAPERSPDDTQPVRCMSENCRTWFQPLRAFRGRLIASFRCDDCFGRALDAGVPKIVAHFNDAEVA